MSTILQPTNAADSRDALVERLLQSTSGAFDIFTIHIGDRLGLYEVLADDGPLTSVELSNRTGTNERYMREWLEQQTVVGILAVEDAEMPARERRFYLPVGHEEVLVNRDSLDYLAPLTQLVAGAVSPLSTVLEAYRSGRGVPFAAYGDDLREGQARMNRAMFLRQLGEEWLPSIDDVHARLESDPPARVADVGCGYGWSSIGIAKSYPRVLVDGIDVDEPSIERARLNIAEASPSVRSRVRFQGRDAGDPALAERYDLVTAFECVHDMSDPVAVLRSMRRMVKEDGAVIIVDERVGDSFTPNGNEVEWLMYGFSVLHCLPVGMVDQPSAATGTVMRTGTLERYAREAGYSGVEVLPIDHFFFRFYRLTF
jgi:2-polyprenyl-3-methyl-5-hydroxy-6-metoxy-1,4-benzoquinol methylase